MAVRIRLRRTGKKKQPQYRLVVAEQSSPRGGRFLEIIGHYNPRVEPPEVSVNEERALHWLNHGAQPSDTARRVLMRSGVWNKFTGEPVASRPLPVNTGDAEPEPSPSETGGNVLSEENTEQGR